MITLALLLFFFNNKYYEYMVIGYFIINIALDIIYNDSFFSEIVIIDIFYECTHSLMIMMSSINKYN